MAAKKILLMHASLSDNYSFESKENELRGIAPPMGLLYLAAPLIKDGHKIELLDLNVDEISLNDFNKLISKQDFVLISCFTTSIENIKKMIPLIKKANKKAFIICGGPHCNLFEEHIIGSDMTVYGEAEQMISGLINKISLKKSLKGIPGISYCKGKKIVRHKGINAVKDLNESEPPALHLSNEKNYGYFGGVKIGKIASIMSSRGCPFRCSFCTFKGRTKYRELSVDSVINELKRIKQMGYKYVIFSDDNFLLNKKRAFEIMDRVIKEKFGFKMLVECRVDSADFVLYKKMKKAGVMIIQFGIESASQDILNYFNKQTTVSQTINAVRLANKAGLISIGLFISGSPLEKKRHLEATKKFFDSEPLDLMVMGTLNFMKGSDLWDKEHEKGNIKKNEFIVPVYQIYKTPTKEELQANIDYLAHRFYKNKKRISRIFLKLANNGEIGIFLRIMKGMIFKDFMKSIIGKKY